MAQDNKDNKPCESYSDDGDGDGDDNNFVHFDSVEIFWERLHQPSYLSFFLSKCTFGLNFSPHESASIVTKNFATKQHE